MATSSDKARLFTSLHRPGDPVVLYNAWDAGSAKVVAETIGEAIDRLDAALGAERKMTW